MPSIVLPEVIATDRLVLRPFELGDVDDVLAYASDPEWSRYLANTPRPYLRRDAVQFLARQTLADRLLRPAWALVLEGVVIGGINLEFKYGHVVAEIGWSIHRLVWGRGLTTEAARAVVEQAFRAHRQLNRIGATADARNRASQRVMEKIGMSREGTLRQARVSRGEYIDEACFALLRHEWERAAPARD